MKILFITDTYPPHINGAALAAEQLALELAKKNHKIFVIAPSSSFKRHTVRQTNITIYRVRSVPILLERTQRFRISPRPLHDKEIKEIIKEIQPDIIHINEPWLLGLSAIRIAKREKIPLIATHNFMPENLVHYLHLPTKLESMIHITIWKWYAKLYQDFSIVISPTQRAADLLTRYDTSLNIEVVSNGINLNTFKKTNDGNYLKKIYDIPNKQILLFVGRLEKEKNIDVLIRAASLLKDKNDFHVIIVGQGKEKNALKKIAHKVDVSNITFTGLLPKKDLPNIYTLADVFVMPSIAELQSLATMEAMASGLPVVAANAVALPHLVSDKKNGFLFTPGDEKDLAEKLANILDNKKLREKMGKESLQIIKQHDMQKTVAKVESIYNKALNDYSRDK